MIKIPFMMIYVLNEKKELMRELMREGKLSIFSDAQLENIQLKMDKKSTFLTLFIVYCLFGLVALILLRYLFPVLETISDTIFVTAFILFFLYMTRKTKKDINKALKLEREERANKRAMNLYVNNIHNLEKK